MKEIQNSLLQATNFLFVWMYTSEFIPDSVDYRYVCDISPII